MNLQQRKNIGFSTAGRQRQRRAAATVEFAVVAPLLFVLTMGALEIGQYVNVGQTVSEASREGARFAARNGTSTVSAVEAYVQNYINGSFVGLPASTLAEALDVNVSDAAGQPIAGGDLTSVNTGTPINVEVTLDFAAVRWIGRGYHANNTTLRTTTRARRE
jgi:Flp pilus assembly protein TadG